nr:MAG TPA: hypothetical protein [Caudoviricetes sp.]
MGIYTQFLMNYKERSSTWRLTVSRNKKVHLLMCFNNESSMG